MKWNVFSENQPEFGKRVLLFRMSSGRYICVRMAQLKGLDDELFWITENDRFVKIGATDMWMKFEPFVAAEMNISEEGNSLSHYD